MGISRLLIANRGEIAIRIARAAAELGIRTVAVYSEDDAASLHVRRTDESIPLRGKGAAAYLDIAQIVTAAKASGCDAIHPGYGFLSENASFAAHCAEQGILFAGPQPEVLQLFGDKVQARMLAEKNGVPVIAGTSHPTTLEEARAFLAALPSGSAMMIKAIAGGGGRGIREVRDEAQLADAYARCQSEARAAFGCADVYVEQLLPKARHVEVQVIGDGSGDVVHLWERECTLQRRNQKLVEIAPSPTLPHALRERIIAAAVQLARSVRYRSLGTFEFLVDAGNHSDRAPFYFMEANPRLQVEHTVTEEVTGIDLVKAQLQLATGCTLAQAGLTQHEIPMPRGFAVQLRINMETMDTQGNTQPAGGTLAVFEPPSGPGIRVDTCGYAGYTTNPNFDSLLAKLIASTPSGHYPDLLVRAYRALCEFRVEGIDTNIGMLQNLLTRPDVVANRVHTRFVEEHIRALIEPEDGAHQKLYVRSVPGRQPAPDIDPRHPAPEGAVPLEAPMQGSVVAIDVIEGDVVRAGAQVAVIEAMKMEHVVKAARAGIVCKVNATRGEVVFRGYPLVYIEPAEVDAEQAQRQDDGDPDAIRADLAEVQQRRAAGLDAARPDAVARRRKSGQRTARENVADLCDEAGFIEYGALAIAAQRRRRPLEELIRTSPADGLVAGIGSVNGALFDDSRSRCMVLAYDYTVFAGTQGMMNHKKTDRMFQLAEQWKLPVVLFAEGGGGRPGDTDALVVAGLDVMSFINFAKLSGLVPRVGIVSGRCFAGNAAFLGCCDVIIATENATIGMGGPAMIEGGGLGVYAPEEVGPVAMQAPNGVIDIVVRDEEEAVRAAKQYLSYFQGPLAQWECADQRALRRLVPENRLRSYDIRAVIETLADRDSVLELRHSFGVGIVTALIRIEGRPFGLIANNPMHLGGAIDADAADKAARFMQLCDAFDLPILSLCDTPGFMVGPDAEKTAMVRHVSRMFVTAGSISVPFFTVVLRKGYGLGAQAMAGGSFHAPFFTVAWPSGEFGAMGLEGAVRLGYRKELEAVQDPAERKALFEKMVAQSYEQGKAINMASFLEIDDVIDPLATRQWVLRGLRSAPPAPARDGKKRPCIDTW
ncbi:MAG TPA: carboxyl transferase domain-containing protein [Noviherbaspirillum sp.]|uniref:acetyl-CoA carboxylase family protein n=1 Tax=Noviherbaspirillum sp. TaxID=1926288 RepID=UPI002D62715F|nr:carboxyl transferase domain-containing protein [Noviherbaspirillum sp.]HYD93907.1 carboxyl transferase domain-containing protein [Noviherbaspirillum sp.]